MKILNGALFYLSAAIFAVVLLAAGIYLTLPTRNTAATHFDTLIVLGYPANSDGTPSPEQRERVLESVREYKAGIASHIIMTGAAAHNQYIEAHVMSQLAQSQGVPAEAIVEEPQAHNTIQNLFYSAKLMHLHDWSSAEIVSSPSHLPRAAIIVNALNIGRPDLFINWRTHASLWPSEYSLARKLILYTGEARNCLLLRFHGLPTSRLLPPPVPQSVK